MTIKKHSPPSVYDLSSRVTFPLFEPLSTEELGVLELGAETFRAKFPEVLPFPDPFLNSKASAPNTSLGELRIVHGGDAPFKALGEKLALCLRESWKVDVLVIDAHHEEAALASPWPRLYLGGADVNARVMEVACKYQMGLFCSEFPGEEGWGVTTHWELETGFSPCYILTGGSSVSDKVCSAALAKMISPDGKLQWAHGVFSKLFEHFDFDAWVSKFKTSAFARLDLLDEWLEGGRRRPYREVFVEFFTREYQHELPYNAGFLDMGIRAIRCYQRTGSEDALELFRETLWGFWDYLNSKSPQIYISDMDFRMGLFCNYWNWIQHHPLFTDAERLIFDQLLLGATRMIRDYFRHNWKGKRAPHNHQTFKARSLVLAWRYFQERNVPDASTWKEDADFIFRKVAPTRFKFTENAAIYERFVQEHTLVWLETTRQPVSEEMQNNLARYALREWAMVDNFLLPVDYGDCDPAMKPARPFEVAPWLSGGTTEQQELLGLENSRLGVFPWTEPQPYAGFLGLEAATNSAKLSRKTGWRCCPLDPLFAKEMGLTGPAEEHFDKMAWRSGWDSQAAYLALEGIGSGPQRGISHAHHEANGILRANLGGRIWLIRSGYGKKPDGLTDAGKIFSTRQIGPEEHNMLIMRDVESGRPILPPANALLKDYGDGLLPFSVTELENYGGASWKRHVLVLPQIGFIVADRVTPSPTAFPELQWNALGSLAVEKSRAVLEQDGVRLVWENLGTTTSEWKESDIYIWRQHIQNNTYKHTRSWPIQCIQKPAKNQRWFVNAFWLEGTVADAQWNAQLRELSVSNASALSEISVQENRSWGSITIQRRGIRVNFDC